MLYSSSTALVLQLTLVLRRSQAEQFRFLITHTYCYCAGCCASTDYHHTFSLSQCRVIHSCTPRKFHAARRSTAVQIQLQDHTNSYIQFVYYWSNSSFHSQNRMHTCCYYTTTEHCIVYPWFICISDGTWVYLRRDRRRRISPPPPVIFLAMSQRQIPPCSPMPCQVLSSLLQRHQ